jgi:hypothetical protein
VAVYPYLYRPDTKFKDAGEYKVGMHFTGAAEKQMREILDGLYDESQAQAKADLAEQAKKAKKRPRKVKPGPEPYQEHEDGGILVNFKTLASGVSKKTNKPWTRRLPIFDASGTPVSAALKIGGGSILRVGYTTGLYYTALLGAGVTCYLEAVQVIELKTWDGPSAGTFGFEEEEGFSAAEAGEEAWAGDDSVPDEFDNEDEDEDDEDADF